MEKPAPVTLLEHFASVPDPRLERPRWHKLSDILVIAVWAVLRGAESYPAIEDLGTERESWVRQFWELPAGIPSHDTFNRVLRLLDPGEWQSWFLRWRQAVAAGTEGEVVAIEGKALRRSFATGTRKRAIPMGSAGATANGVGGGNPRETRNPTRSRPLPRYWPSWPCRGVGEPLPRGAVSGTSPRRLSRRGQPTAWPSRALSPRWSRR